MTPFALTDSGAALEDDAFLSACGASTAKTTSVDAATKNEAEDPIDDNQCDHEHDDEEISEVEVTEAMATEKEIQAEAVVTKHIRFADADVIEFEPTVWTATTSSDGVPVGLSSTVRRRTRRRLDSFENERQFSRIGRHEYMEHGYLEPDERLDILEAAGHSQGIIGHVERETIRINRERWESNEYDLLYQFGLGETAALDLDEDEELALSQGTITQRLLDMYDDEDDEDEDEDMDILGDDDVVAANPDAFHYYSNRNVLDNGEESFDMDDMDAYDARRYEEWAWDYTTDCMMGENVEEQVEMPYSDASCESPANLDFDIDSMSSSPTDVSAAAECMGVSKAGSAGSSSTSASARVLA